MNRKTARLPVLDTFGMLFSSLRRKRSGLTRALIFPVLCITGLYIYRTVHLLTFTGDKVQFAIFLNVIAIILIVLWALLAVSCHRVLLEDSDKPSMVDGVWLGWRQIKYGLTGIVVALPMLAYLVSSGYIGWQLFERFGDDVPMLAKVAVDWAFFIPALYLSSRVALALPAAALQRPLSYAQAWVLSRGNGWRITAILMTARAASDLIYYPIASPLWEMAPAGVAVIGAHGMQLLTSLAVGIISIGALSFIYQFLVEQSPPSA